MTSDCRLGMPAIDDEIVALGLAADRLMDGRLQEIVALARPQRRAQVGGVILAEAHVERTRAGEPHAVAALAEIMRQRRDEAKATAGLAHAHIAGRPARAIVDLV